MIQQATAKKPHVSFSSLDMYWRCPEQYRRVHILHERLQPGVAAMTGTGVHRGAEVNFTQKIDSHRDLPPSDIVDAAVAAFEKEAAGGYSLSKDEESIGADKVLGEAKDKLVKIAHLHATEQAPEYQPTEVEHFTRIVFPDATHDLVAITDLRDDRQRVVDFKTAARKMPAGAADESLQLTIYAAAYRVERGDMPAEVRLDLVTKASKPARQVLTSKRNATDLRVMVNRVNVTLAAINHGDFPPASPGHWCCSPKWCGFFSSCPYVNSERLALAAEES